MLQRPSRALLAAALALGLAGCALPRGAAVQSEVLAAAGRGPDGEAVPAGFAVEAVTREALPRLAAWPLSGEAGQRWIARQPEPANRIIAAGDQLAVTVWDTEENALLTGPGQRSITMAPLTVSAAGSVFMPYVGDLRVAGMSPDRARESIEAAFVEVTPSAQVQLELTEQGSGSTVSLVGGVGAPGGYPLPDQSYTVLALIADGGGVSPDLNNPQIKLVRDGAIFSTSIDRLFAEPGLDATLRGGDRVIVEADDRYFLSLGAAGSEAVHPFPRDSVTALEALSIIGGVSDQRADPQGILVLRDYPAAAVRADGSGPPEARVVFTLDLTSADGLFSAGEFRIHSGDLVYATESRITSAQTIVGLLGSTLGVVRQAVE